MGCSGIDGESSSSIDRRDAAGEEPALDSMAPVPQRLCIGGRPAWVDEETIRLPCRTARLGQKVAAGSRRQPSS